MKFLLLILAWFGASVGIAVGQGITIDLVLEQEQYLPGEAIPVKVRVTNFSGNNLTLGKDDSWLSLFVDDARHLVVSKQQAIPVAGEFTLEPSMTGTKKIDLAPYFDLTQPGRYSVHASVIVSQWNQAFETKPVSFDIIRGNSIWEQEFGVPGTDANGTGTPELRRYALVQTRHTKTVKLYFRLGDTSGNKVFRLFPLGLLVSYSNPEPQLDKFSNLHVLYQTGARAFSHCVITPDGLLIARENYEILDKRPALRAEPSGRISVVGGTRVPSISDLPPANPSPKVLPNAKLDTK